MSELPVGWCAARLSDLADAVRGVTYNKSQAQDEGGSGLLPILRANNVKAGKISFKDLVYVPEDCVSSAQTLLQGDIVVAMSSGSRSVVGKAAQIETAWQGSFGAFCGVLRARQGIDCRYLYHFTQARAYRARVSELAAGVNINNLKPSHFEEIEVPLAPPGEQKRIAQKLDALLAQVDTLKARIDAIPALLKRFQKSILASAVTGELTTEWRVDKGVNKEDWDNSAIGAAAFVTKLAGFEYTKFVRYEPGGDMSVIKAENVGKAGFKATKFSTVRSQEVTSLTRSKITGGEILMVFVGAGTGQVATVPRVGNWFLGPNIAMIRPDTNVVISKYLEHYCRSPQGWNEMSSFLKSTAQPCLSMKTIRQIGLPLPSIDEQTEIVRRVEQLFAFADQLEAKVATAKQRIDTLTQSLLAKAFRGELVPQDPNDEPASVLLERIRAQRGPAPKPRRGRKPVSST